MFIVYNQTVTGIVLLLVKTVLNILTKNISVIHEIALKTSREKYQVILQSENKTITF